MVDTKKTQSKAAPKAKTKKKATKQRALTKVEQLTDGSYYYVKGFGDTFRIRKYSKGSEGFVEFGSPTIAANEAIKAKKVFAIEQAPKGWK